MSGEERFWSVPYVHGRVDALAAVEEYLSVEQFCEALADLDLDFVQAIADGRVDSQERSMAQMAQILAAARERGA